MKLGTKFNFLAIVLILVTSLSIGAFVVHTERKHSYGDLLRHSASTATRLAQTSEYGIYTENQDTLRQLVENLGVHSDIAYIAILTKEKQLLVENSFVSPILIPTTLSYTRVWPQRAPLFADFSNPADGNAYTVILAPVVSRAKTETSELFLELNKPTQTQTIGYVQLVITHQGMHERTQAFVVSIALFTSFLILLGVSITVLMTRRIASPVQRLSAETQDIAEGKLDHQIEITSRDEISDLATAFNRMTERLRDYRGQVESSQRTLEEKVEQRTSALREATEQAYELAHQAEAANRAKSQF